VGRLLVDSVSRLGRVEPRRTIRVVRLHVHSTSRLLGLHPSLKRAMSRLLVRRMLKSFYRRRMRMMKMKTKMTMTRMKSSSRTRRNS
jgi:hypothetical protein